MKVGKNKVKKTEEAVEKPVVDEEKLQLKTQLARALADYDNLRKRTDEEKNVWFRVAGSRIIEKFLGIYDMLVSAQTHINDQGLAIVLGEFKRAVEEEGFEELNLKVGETAFNSQEMDAVDTIETEEEGKKDKVAEVLLTGWKEKNGGEVLRHAKVKVYKLKENNN